MLVMAATIVIGLAICHLIFWLEGDYDGEHIDGSQTDG